MELVHGAKTDDIPLCVLHQRYPAKFANRELGSNHDATGRDDTGFFRRASRELTWLFRRAVDGRGLHLRFSKHADPGRTKAREAWRGNALEANAGEVVSLI